MSSALIEVPVRFVCACGRGIKAALGPLITKDFWIKVMALCAKEMVAAFMKTLGGKFMSYGVSREDQEIKKASQTVAGSVFSNGAPPRSEYPYHSPSQSYNAFNHQKSAVFPGFNS